MMFGQSGFTGGGQMIPSAYNSSDVKRRSSYAVNNTFRPHQTPRSFFNQPQNMSPGAFNTSDYQQNGHSQSAINTRSTSNENHTTPSAFSPAHKHKNALNYSSSFHQKNFYHQANPGMTQNSFLGFNSENGAAGASIDSQTPIGSASGTGTLLEQVKKQKGQ